MLDYYKNSSDVASAPGTEETFESLKSNHVKIGLDTGFSRPIVDVILDRMGWKHQGF